MPRSERTLLIEQIRELLLADGRFADFAFQFRVYERVDGSAVPGKLLPTVYGGRFDRLSGAYITPQPKDLEIHEVECHAGQLPVLVDRKGQSPFRLVALGSPGAGKTFAAVRRALRNVAERPCSIGALVAPTNDRRLILWRDFLELAETRGLVRSIQQTRKEIVMTNGTVVQVLAAASQSSSRGNPLQGRSWDWAVIDESQNVDDGAHVEIATRGRRAGSDYAIVETCTNASVPAFRVRMERYKNDPQVQVVRFRGNENPWIDPDWWERLKGDLSERDYRSQILVEDLQPELLVYSAFEFSENLQPVPINGVDVTREITHEKYNHAASYVIGQDFGVLVNVSVVLKAFRMKDKSIAWWAIDELTTYQQTTEVHAALLKERYPNMNDCVVIADPHFNSKEADKSDYHKFREVGWTLYPSVHGKIPIKHRISMMNSLFKDAKGTRRLFLDCDRNKRPACQKFAEALMSHQYDQSGKPQPVRKDRRDMTHWPDAVGYGLFPFERIRGGGTVRPL